MAPEGSYYLLARVDATGLASPQYYPGVVDPRQAPRTRIGGGMDLGGMDLHLVTQPLYRIRFQLPAAGEHPGLPLPDPDPSADSDPRIDVSLRSVGPGVLDPAVTLVDLEELGDGMYRTSPIPPGEYDMMIRYRAVQETNFHEGSFVVTTPIDRFRVVVTDEDVDLGAVSASPRVSVRGRVEVRTTRAGRPAPARVTQVALREVSRGLFGSVAEVGPDGAFAIDDLFPGVFAFLPLTRELPDPWYLAAVTSGARDVLRHGLETGGGPLNPIDVVIADDAARVTGVVRREDATLVPEARIVLIPPANRRGPLSSFPTSVADAGGVFGLRTVPPGEYRILALDEAGRQAQSPLVLPYWEAPDFLARYESRGEVLEIEPGGEIVVNPGVVVVRD
jgi:hypothetical protein